MKLYIREKKDSLTSLFLALFFLFSVSKLRAITVQDCIFALDQTYPFILNVVLQRQNQHQPVSQEAPGYLKLNSGVELYIFPAEDEPDLAHNEPAFVTDVAIMMEGQSVSRKIYNPDIIHYIEGEINHSVEVYCYFNEGDVPVEYQQFIFNTSELEQ
ncbi:hypothetical protein [Spongorhabdus nitratireducens]